MVIGGGFFGATLSVALARRLRKVLVVERESDLLRRASFVNQARVHRGYHYPRSLLTALRSRVNFERFVREYEPAIDRSFTQIYAVARIGSHVSGHQFREFCERVGAPTRPAPPSVLKLLDRELVESAFEVCEYAFNADTLRALTIDNMRRAGAETRVGVEVLAVHPDRNGGGLCIECQTTDVAERLRYSARFTFVCAYSQVNRVLQRSGLEPIPLKHELVEISLIEPPVELARYGVTVMDGPFFGTMPFPARGVHSLYHVRYAPHYAWHEGPGANGCPPASELDIIDRQVADRTRASRYPHAIRDAQRYLPVLAKARLRDSLWEIRTVLPQSEADDSRPILFRRHHGLKNLFCVTGAKIDNIFDLLDELAAVDLS